MTEEELNAVREFMGDLLIRSFRGEVDLATALSEVRDLDAGELAEEPDLSELDDLEDEDGGDNGAKPKVQQTEVHNETPPAGPSADELDASATDLDGALEVLAGLS